MTDDAAPAADDAGDADPSRPLDPAAAAQAALERSAAITARYEKKGAAQADGREPVGGRLIPEEELDFDEDGHPVVSDADWETTARVLQLLYRFPEMALLSRYIRGSRGHVLRENVRVNAMRWLKPGQVVSTKEVIRAKASEEKSLLLSTGIRLLRNRKKRLLPQQMGQVVITLADEDAEDPHLAVADYDPTVMDHSGYPLALPDLSPDGIANANAAAAALARSGGTDAAAMRSQLAQDAAAPANSAAGITVGVNGSGSGAGKFNPSAKAASAAAGFVAANRAALAAGGKGRVHPAARSLHANAAAGTAGEGTDGHTGNDNDDGNEDDDAEDEDEDEDDGGDDAQDDSTAAAADAAASAGEGESEMTRAQLRNMRREQRRAAVAPRRPEAIQAARAAAAASAAATAAGRSKKEALAAAEAARAAASASADGSSAQQQKRARHATAYSADVPQPRASALDADVDAAVLAAAGSLPGGAAAAAAVIADVASAAGSSAAVAKFLGDSAVGGGRYARVFNTGSNARAGAAAVPGRVTAAEVHSDSDGEDLANTKEPATAAAAAAPAPAVTSTGSGVLSAEEARRVGVQDPSRVTVSADGRLRKRGKQESAAWVAKEGMYGGAVAVDSHHSEHEEHSDGDGDGNGDGEEQDGQQQDDAKNNLKKKQAGDSTSGSKPVVSTTAVDAYQQQVMAAAAAATAAAAAAARAEALRSGRPRFLPKSIPCYVCKKHFKQLHHFYDRMCPVCADFNFAKRYQSADMRVHRTVRSASADASADAAAVKTVTTQRVALVTGARVKIGYEIALKLLRAGAFVIATSRFANDTALRFTREPDFVQWADSLHVYALDLRVLSAIELFCAHLLRTYDRLDCIINNAAQTIRRPPQFYRHLLQGERVPLEMLPPSAAALVRSFVPDEVRKAASSPAAVQGLLQAMNGAAHGVSNGGVAQLTFAPKTSEVKSESGVKKEAMTDDSNSNSNSISASSGSSASADTEAAKETVTDTEADSAQSKTEAEAEVEAELKREAEAEQQKRADETRVAEFFGNQAAASTRLVAMLSLPQAAAVNPAELSQIALVAGDEDKPEDAVLFPAGSLDKDDQQVDLRPKQTWVLQMGEVSAVEMIEVQTVNAMAPFLLNTRLKPLLLRARTPTWIVNVSSMEGKFRGFKDTTHAHTNMAKAALNMQTHTAGKDYAHDRIFLNAVDTGWVTEELPHELAVHKAQLGFAPPLDEIDGASRVLDPVFTSLLTGVYEFGKFFKDYAEGHW